MTTANSMRAFSPRYESVRLLVLEPAVLFDIEQQDM